MYQLHGDICSKVDGSLGHCQVDCEFEARHCTSFFLFHLYFYLFIYLGNCLNIILINFKSFQLLNIALMTAK